MSKRAQSKDVDTKKTGKEKRKTKLKSLKQSQQSNGKRKLKTITPRQQLKGKRKLRNIKHSQESKGKRKLKNLEHSQSSKAKNKVPSKVMKKRRSHRVASLNAIAKVHLLYETKRKNKYADSDGNSRPKTVNKSFDVMDKKSDAICPSVKSVCNKSNKLCKTKTAPQTTNKMETRKSTESKKAEVNTCRALVPVKKPKKRKNEVIEIIDTKRCKRLASLNASAILAASYLPERGVAKRRKSLETNHSVNSVEVFSGTQISSVVSRVEMTPESTLRINGAQQLVVGQTEKHVKMLKEVQRASGKIRERLLAMELLDDDDINNIEIKNKVGKMKGSSGCSKKTDLMTEKNRNRKMCHIHQHSVTSSQITEYQVTKVQINHSTSQRTRIDKEKKSEHKIDVLLEKDPVIRKYQVQTTAKSQSYSVQMQTTLNPPTTTQIVSVAPQNAINLTASSAPIIPPSSLITPSYLNFANPAPILQVACNQQPYAQINPPLANSTINPLPLVNITGPFASHYTSAFSVPHFASQPAYAPNYGFYQPAGPMIQPVADTCLIHKPIPFHPSTPMSPHLHHSHSPYPTSFQATQPSQQVSGIVSPFQINNNPQAQFVLHCESNRNLLSRQTPTVYCQTSPTSNILASPLNVSPSYMNCVSTPSIMIPNNSVTEASNIINLCSDQPRHSCKSVQCSDLDDNSIICDQVTSSTQPNNRSNVKTVIDQSPQIVSQVIKAKVKKNVASKQNAVFSSSSNKKLKNYSKKQQIRTQRKTPLQNMEQLQQSLQHRQNQFVPQKQFSQPQNMLNHVNENVILSKIQKQQIKNTNVELKSKLTTSSSSVEPNALQQKRQQMKLPHEKRQSSQTSRVQKLETVHQPVNQDLSLISVAASNKSNKIRKAVVAINKPTVVEKTLSKLPVLPSIELPLSSLATIDKLSSKKLAKKKYFHGWCWEGTCQRKPIFLNNEEPPQVHKCYPAIRHAEGDIIRVRDCVLLRSGPRKTDLPFVAKIAALWESSDEGNMMINLLWYYRPEHTEMGRRPNQMVDEILSSKHRDVNSVACIDDKCYVLTYNEYCRFKKRQKMLGLGIKKSITECVVPHVVEVYPRQKRMPPNLACPDMIFCCRKVYDFKQKRILKNPI